MKPSFLIANRLVSDSTPALIIAEIGINHNGSLDRAIAIADSAIEAGAEVIKHQTHIPDEEMSVEAKSIKPGNSNKNIYEIIKKCSLNESDEKKLFDYIKKKKKIIISTPFSKKAVDRLVGFKVPAFKIGSGECNNYDLINYICKFKKPIILSTGMNDIRSIKKSVNIIKKKKVPLALLHCINLYPAPAEFLRLNSILDMKKFFKGLVIGYSDHSEGTHSAISAITLGAKILEKHYVDTKLVKGPDISCSMDRHDLQKLITASKDIFVALNNKYNSLTEQSVTMNFAFASLVAKHDIKAGEKVSKNNTCFKRPGTGSFNNQNCKSAYGRISKKFIRSNTQILKTYLK
jgi:N-acetylneuraminate synthase